MSSTNHRHVRSMTGQGHASRQTDQGSILVEVRTVNNRGFKCTLRSSDALSGFDSRIETLARSLIHRGSVSLSILWKRPIAQSIPQIDQDVLQGYFRQLQAGRKALGDEQATIDLAQLAMLPGVVIQSQTDGRDNKELWDTIEQTIRDTFENLNSMREQEGAHMAETLLNDCDAIGRHVEEIQTLAPRCIEAYQTRLETKVQRLLAKHEVEVSKIDLLREVQIYADRADFSEEITRLASHLKMIRGVIRGSAEVAKDPEPTGRKLEFIVQELLRETNTIGSKASDTDISAHVVEIKCAIERMRELVQNLE
ncbi:YicC/YloC family endoribonuclease [Planctomycetes bacterium CA13]